MATQLVQFIVGLVLARILSPAEFGLVGMITVFLAISQSIADGGFGEALIRKKEAGDADYSTVFYFNLTTSVVIFILFYLFAPAIAGFYRQPELIDISRALGTIIVINALCITQRIQLTRKVNFKSQMKINLTSTIISGIVAIVMALWGYGVWSLVWRSIIRSVIQAFMLWYTSKWVPSLVFSRESFRALFSFGSKLLLSGLIDTIYNNVYLLIIGKFFSAPQLGYYTRADQFSRLAVRNLTGTVQRVSFPVLSQVQDDNQKLREGFRKVIITIMLITFFILLGMAAIAEPMVLTLIGEKWLPSVEYLQLLCFASLLYPLHALNMNLLSVKGRSDLLLKLEIVKKLLAVPVIIAGIFLGIRALLIGMIVLSFITYFMNSYYSGRLINYSSREQLADILPSFMVATFISLMVFAIKYIPGIPPPVTLAIQLPVLFFLIILLGRLFKLQGYTEIKNIIPAKASWLKKVL